MRAMVHSFDSASIRDWALRLPEVTEGMPFDQSTLVFKVQGKIFLLLSLEADPLRATFKASPEEGLQLRAEYEAVIPGYHTDKRHWNTVTFDPKLPPELLQGWFYQSYLRVVEGLPQYQQKPIHQSLSLSQ